MREALVQKQFVLHYQAQVESGGKLVGAEVLVRWRHPVRGWIYPDDFIGIAEATGLIVPLGAWILRTACVELARWAGHTDTELLTLAVNVSARQFQHVGFVRAIRAWPTSSACRWTNSRLTRASCATFLSMRTMPP